MEQAKRKATIEKAATLKINLGNYENFEFFECLKLEVEFGDQDELKKKSDAVTRRVIEMLKSDTEQALQATGRQRVVNNQPAELWARGA